jgi:probable HAF family extracellular repeat protein
VATFDAGTVVLLTATPDAVSNAALPGLCTAATCAVTVQANSTLLTPARFDLRRFRVVPVFVPAGSWWSSFSVTPGGFIAGNFGGSQGHGLVSDVNSLVSLARDIGPVFAVMGANDSGTTIGITLDGKGFSWQNGIFTTLFDAGLQTGFVPTAINREGLMVGYPLGGGGVATFEHGTMKVRATNGLAQAVNSSGVIVGNRFDFASSTDRVARFNPDGSTDDLGAPGRAFSINDQGTIVGQQIIAGPTPQPHGFVYTDAKGMVDVGVLPGDVGSGLSSINASGTAVGFSQPPGKISRAILYENGQIYDLNSLLDPGSEPVFTAGSIDDAGHIAAQDMRGMGVIVEPL